MIDHVIIERESESTVMFVEGAKDAYLGYVTLRVSILLSIQYQIGSTQYLVVKFVYFGIVYHDIFFI